MLKDNKEKKSGSIGLTKAGIWTCTEVVCQYGIEEELKGLRRDMSVLMVEIVRLRQLQQHSKDKLISMENKLRTTENKL
ncbi:putative Heat shock transcription factor family [Helianthus annuus]|nr:putative Heat shock transcription factor family [Helianthus annuus]KAJ0934050.1 putative Heat shock transcription factor family [Helianthus annuus]